MKNMSTMSKEAQEQCKKVLRACGSKDEVISRDATRKIAKALETPLRKGILSGDILDGIFEPIVLDQNATSEFPLDFISPGTENQFVAYTIPNQGYIPMRQVEGDYVQVPVYDVGASIDWLLKYARDARWDIVGRAMDVMRKQFTKKFNDDGWHTLLAAAVDRNIIVLDSDASAGQFTKRVVSLMKLVMRRNGGGNSTSLDRGALTDLYSSPEAMEDIRNWNVDQVDEITRREIFVSDSDQVMSRIFGINLHTIDELGEGQEYQNYFANDLSGTMPSDKVEIIIGLDLRANDSFVMPIREEVEIFDDPALHRQKKAGVYGWASVGFASLDGRRVLTGAL